ncbi:DENN domain-containing protein 5A-like isoform X2 [Biomphalaria glabrata]|uniref:DENN domain-containing protein 5A-like isoform X2 n=1 Tax=Biomphalaria glabrata TaxID=6526 RepID=A0A2C9K4J2_BIOGL|nr:DENN domain-containing protein 5A-like isoform X2 [Biomphalaria glabrata]
MAVQDKPFRFVDYFVICGLDENADLEPDKLSGDTQQSPPLERPYKSRVLAHFPENVTWNPFDENAVGMLCLPRGLSFKTQWDSRQPKFHSFVITRENGSKAYGSALIFYEEVMAKSVLDTMQTLHAMHQANVAVKFSLDSPEPVRRIMSERKSKQCPFDAVRDKLFVSKCICLVTPMPFVRSCQQFLYQLYEASQKPSQLTMTLESYVFNIIYDVPLPPSGRSMQFFSCASPIYVIRPSTDDLPLLDFSLYDMFKLLGIDGVVDIFKCVLLEHQILLYSSDYQRLMLVAEGMTSLIFPFQWQLVYVPILPASMQHFLDAPVPFIMGLYKVSNTDKSQLVLPSEANMCFVEIDNKNIDFPEDLPMFPYQNELKIELTQVINKYQNIIGAETMSRSYPTTPRRETGYKSSSGLRPDDTSNTNTGSWPNSPKRKEILQNSEAWKKISSIAKKTGVWDSIEDIVLEDSAPGDNDREKDSIDGGSGMPSCEVNTLKFNNAVREIVLNCFVHMFSSYENFVINPSQDLESWLSNRETIHNFDKAAFLSDQPASHLPFLSAFIETQMFTTLMDNKIVSQWEETDPGLQLFDARIKNLKDAAGGEPRIITYSPCSTMERTEQSLEKKAKNINFIACKPHEIASHISPSQYVGGVFPLLSKELLNSEPANSKSKFRENAKWRRKDRQLQHKEHLQTNVEADQQEQYLRIRKPQLPDMSQAGTAQTNWKFVETLLKECKTKTKKMLVDKMGQEAVELGHGEASIIGVEENTLIASLCDLLERIWSHGLQAKKGKSAVWSHLLSYQETEESSDNKPVDPKLLTPGLPKRHSLIDIKSLVDSSFTILGRSISLSSFLPKDQNNYWENRKEIDLSNIGMDPDKVQQERGSEKTHRRRGSQGRIELPVLRPMPKSLLIDMKKIQQMSDIHTDVGKTRALIRLALERKMLSAHLKQLLSNTDLLRNLYKRYAFLRCEDEREQFLYHLLSLNAVDFFCFTNIFPNSVVPYRILVYPSTKLGCSTTSANVWISLAGQMGETGSMELPKSLLEMNFEHKNLGILTTLRIGHDNSGMMPRWLVEYVLVRNELTGHTYRFNCGRWLGRGIDDGSTERLLVAELMHHTIDTEDEVVVTSPPRTCSPKSPRKSHDANSGLADIQENLGQAVNNLVKHFYKPEKERGNITYLLCGDKGLVHCMEQVFQFGFRSSRLFRNKIFIWDYMERLKTFFESALSGNTSHQLNEVTKAGYWLFCDLVGKINTASDTVGKDGKFQVFICVGIRKRCLHRWLPLMADTTVTAQMYEENSFLRNQAHINFVMHILDSLTEFDIPLETSLLRGIDLGM